MDAQEPATWQELLAQLVTSPKERKRLAAAVHVNPITLQRWIEGSCKPRIGNIRLLLQSLPAEIQPSLLRLLVPDFSDLLDGKLSGGPAFQGIPSEFYACAMSNMARTPRSIYRQSMQDLVLQQALELLDPDRQGLAVTLAVCMPPRFGQKVRSLREAGRLATPPWPRDLAGRGSFLGAESLAGHAVAHTYAAVINRREEQSLFAVQWTEYEESTAAFPILFRARIVGCLVVSSVHKDFFTKPRLALIADYAHLAACIFDPEESFDQSEIALEVMPSCTSQWSSFADYHQRVSRKLLEGKATGHSLTLQQARQMVWQDLEDLLLQTMWDRS